MGKTFPEAKKTSEAAKKTQIEAENIPEAEKIRLVRKNIRKEVKRNAERSVTRNVRRGPKECQTTCQLGTSLPPTGRLETPTRLKVDLAASWPSSGSSRAPAPGCQKIFWKICQMSEDCQKKCQ